MAAIGRIGRFDSPHKLVAYIGLNPSVHQSGDSPAYHGRITKRGCSNARHLGRGGVADRPKPWSITRIL